MSGEQNENTSPQAEKSTPSKRGRLSAVEKAKLESEEVIKQMGGTLDVEGGRRTRSSARGNIPKSPAPATPPPAKKARASTTPSSRRGRPKKLDIADDEENEVSEVNSKDEESKKKDNIPEKEDEADTANIEKDDKSHEKTKETTPKKLNTSDVVDSTQDVDEDQKKEDDVTIADKSTPNLPVETEIPPVENKKSINVPEIISAEIPTDKSEKVSIEEIEEKSDELDGTNLDPIVEIPDEDSQTTPISEENIPEKRSKTSVPEIHVDEVEPMEVDGTKDAEAEENNVAQKTSEDHNKVVNNDLNTANKPQVNITEIDTAMNNTSAIVTKSVVNLDAPTVESIDIPHENNSIENDKPTEMQEEKTKNNSCEPKKSPSADEIVSVQPCN